MMSNGNNPFAGAGGQMNASVSYGNISTPSAADTASRQDPFAQPVKADLIKDTTTADFAADVLTASQNQPVLVDFWAPWCGPCRQLTPVLESAIQAAGGAVRLVKMNIDDHPSVAGQLGVQSIPAVIAFVNGQPVDGFMGALPESQIKQFIEKIVALGGGADAEAEAALGQALQAAADMQEQGQPDDASQIYAAILQQMPENIDALAGLAGCLLDQGNVVEARELLDTVPEDKSQEPVLRSVAVRLELAEQVAHLGNPAELEARLQANSQDHQARFDLAQIANAMGQRDEAVDGLLAIMKADREWNDDGARKQLLQFFEAWGFKDPATISGRRKLSSLLFA